MGFTLQGFLLDAIGAPLGALALLTLPAGPNTPPRGGGHGVAVFRALLPRRVRADTGIAGIPAVDPFLGFVLPELAPVRPGARFHRGASPLALRRLHVKARPGPRVLQCERVGRSVSGPPALVGFRTFRRTRRSVRRIIGAGLWLRLTQQTAKQLTTIQAPQSRRNSRSRACCPAPAPIGLRSVTSSVRQRSLTKELETGIASVLQSIEAPGDCLGRLAATSADSRGVARSSEDTSASA
jgi:hypothetical protein